jgi:hypothetical protein
MTQADQSSVTLPVEPVVKSGNGNGIEYETVEMKSKKEILSGLRQIATGLGMIINAYIRMNGLK